MRRGAFVRRCDGAFAFFLHQDRRLPAPRRLRALRRHLSISAQSDLPPSCTAAPAGAAAWATRAAIPRRSDLARRGDGRWLAASGHPADFFQALIHANLQQELEIICSVDQSI